MKAFVLGLLIICLFGCGGGGSGGSMQESQPVPASDPLDIQITATPNPVFEQEVDGTPKGAEVTIQWEGTLGSHTSFYIEPIGKDVTFSEPTGQTTYRVRLDTTFQVWTEGGACERCSPVDVEVDYSDVEWGILDIPNSNFVVWKTDYPIEAPPFVFSDPDRNLWELGRYFNPESFDFLVVLDELFISRTNRLIGGRYFSYGAILKDGHVLDQIELFDRSCFSPPGSICSSGALTHEIAHRWAQIVDDSAFRETQHSKPAFEPRGLAPNHWGLTSVHGVLGGLNWATVRSLGDREYTAEGNPWFNHRQRLAPLELLLMGFEVDIDTVPDIQWAVNAELPLNDDGDWTGDIPVMFTADCVGGIDCENGEGQLSIEQYLEALRQEVKRNGRKRIGGATPIVQYQPKHDRLPWGGDLFPKKDQSKVKDNFHVLTVMLVNDDFVPTLAQANDISEDIERYTNPNDTGDQDGINFYEATRHYATLQMDGLDGDDKMYRTPLPEGSTLRTKPGRHGRCMRASSGQIATRRREAQTMQTCQLAVENVDFREVQPHRIHILTDPTRINIANH